MDLLLAAFWLLFALVAGANAWLFLKEQVAPDGRVLLQPHPASSCQPRIFELEAGVDIIGQVVAVAMPLDAKLGRISPKVQGN